MLASNNILKPSDGRPVTLPSQDMIIGLHHLTTVTKEAPPRENGEFRGKSFSSIAEAILAFDQNRPGDVKLELGEEVRIRLDGLYFAEGAEPAGFESGTPFLLETTLGRALFNEALPVDYPYFNEQAGKGQISSIVNDLAERYPKTEVAATLDRIKDAGFRWATRSGVTVALSDIVELPQKREIVSKYEKQAAKVQAQFEKGLTTDLERRQELIQIWTKATDEVAKAMQEEFAAQPSNTINRMVTSGARGNWLQVRNIAGMRGLVNNPKGEIIPRPIISSYREGLSVAEYFIATHGARKGLADTALRTADSGYLTRRLVDVSQDVIIREDDCGTTKGLELPIAVVNAAGELVRDPNVENSVFARSLAADAVDAKGEVIAEAGADVGDVLIDKLVAAGVETIRVRSVLTCESAVGVCAACYGRSLATGKLVDLGEAVGIIAAQSIGEPGTQLTMRTFHTGGSASADDITQGLPRVQELFEARTPKRVAHRRGRRSHHDRRERQAAQGHPHARQRRRAGGLQRAASFDAARRGRPARGARSADHRRRRRPEGSPPGQGRARRAEAPRERCAGSVPLAGRADPRQAHRGHRASDAAQGHRRRPRRHRPASGRARRPFEVQRDQPCGAHRGQEDGVGPPGGHGYHQGLARDRVVAVGRVLPGDDPRAHAGRHGGQERPAGRPQGERHHRQAHPPAGTGLAKYRNVAVEATEEAKAERYPNRIFADDAAFSEGDLSFVDFDAFSSDDFTPGNYS